MILPAQQSLLLHPTRPFHFDSSLHKPDHFPSSDNHWQPGVRWQTMLWQGTPLGLKFEQVGMLDKPAVRLSIWSEQPLEPGFVQALAHAGGALPVGGFVVAAPSPTGGMAGTAHPTVSDSYKTHKPLQLFSYIPALN